MARVTGLPGNAFLRQGNTWWCLRTPRPFNMAVLQERAHWNTACAYAPCIHLALVVSVSTDIVFQLPDQVGLLDDGLFHQITNRQEANQLITFHHR